VIEVFRRAASSSPDSGDGVAAPMSASTTREAVEAPPLSCGQSDRVTGWVCTMTPHQTPVHRDQSDDAFECTWSDR
jgi:hypothetical protein